MKKVLIISILLALGLNGFGQSSKIEVSEMEFMNNSTWIDTFERVSYYSDNTIKKVEVLSNVESNIKGVKRHHLFYHSEKKYKANRQLKYTKIYTEEKLTHHIYDHKGRDSWIFINEYENPNVHILTVYDNGHVIGKMDIYTEYFYYTGKLVHKKLFKKGKKHGRCEFYDDKTGALKKIVIYNEGKKISTEKLELN